VRAGETARLRTDDRHSTRRVTLLEFSLSDMLLSSATLPPVGANVGVAITLRDRHIEFELPGVVLWHRENDFAIELGHLTARQTYGLTLALELERQAAEAAPRVARLARG
jgi:hypothetical protein